MVYNLDLKYRIDVQLNPKLDGSLTPLNYRAPKHVIMKIMEDEYEVLSFPCDGPHYMNNLTCNAGKHLLSISPDGDVKPCVIFPVSCGNIRTTSVKNIWNTGKGILKDLRSLKFEDLKSCLDCVDRSYCSRCHAESYLQTGDISNPSPGACDLAKLRHELSLERRAL
jgi:radical SAM protein with 4Fe4S-binding SPASM domain